jgi:hypothetical protein
MLPHRMLMCRFLVEAAAASKVDIVNARTVHQTMPLWTAAQNGHIEVCRFLIEAGSEVDARSNQQETPLWAAANNGDAALCMVLILAGAEIAAVDICQETPADIARQQSHYALADHLQYSGGVHYLRCTGPSLERTLVWNGSGEWEGQEPILIEMQLQWLARVAEGCARARVGLTMQGAFDGRLSKCVLVNILRYLFEGTEAHLLSCLSTRRAPGKMFSEAGLAAVPMMTAPVAIKIPRGTRTKTGSTTGVLTNEHAREPSVQAQQPHHKDGPRLVLVSYDLALEATVATKCRAGSACYPSRKRTCRLMLPGQKQKQLEAQLLSVAVAQLSASSEAADGGCEWLHGYCTFLQQRYRLLGGK